MLKKMILAVSVSVLLATAMPVVAKPPIKTVEGTVTKVSDGDTIQVTDNLGTVVKARFYGVDTPETEKGNKKTGKVSKPGQPYGEEAFQALRKKVEGKQVRLDIMDIDQYKRSVAIVWLGNRNINLEMVADGWAWAYRQYLDRAYASEYIAAEEKARKAKKGLWQQGGNIQPPWEFRKALKIR